MHHVPLLFSLVIAPAGASELDPDAYDALLEDEAGFSPDAFRGRVHPLDRLLPPVPPVPAKEGEGVLRGFPADHPGASTGALSGRAVYLSQCHGWIWYDSLGRFSTQRGNVWDTVEDIHNPEGMDQFLTAYLENAGAAVFTVKDRDNNPLMAVADNDGAGFVESGSGFEAGGAGFADAAPYAYGENPFQLGTTRRFPADGGGKATWTPDVPAEGSYAVYVAWDSDAANAPDAHYRITHPGGVIDRWYDQTVHGSTWQYVETLWLEEGASITVELLGDSASSGRWLSADAVRIGGGMGQVERNGKTTGRPRFEEGAILSTQFNGAPTSVYDPYGDGDGSDPSSRSRWAAWEHPTGEDAVYLSWHSNACDGCGARGTSTYTYDSTCSSGAAATGSLDMAEAVHDEIVSMAQANWDSEWRDRGTRTDCFSENNPSHNPEMPSVLVELAFHDTEIDADFLKDPQFRRDASRAMYRGIVRYFAERDGGTARYLPEPPDQIALVHGGDGRLVASWAPGPSGWPDGDAATGYRVYTSKDGRSWDNGVAVTGTSHVLATKPGVAVYVRVAATNAGGTSFPSEVVGARRSPDGTAPVLVVGAFDRLDAGQLDWDYPHSSLGDIVRMDVRRMNASDVIVPHGRAIDAAGWPFDSAADEALAGIDLSDYALVVWATGEESTVDETFSTAQQASLRAFVDGGGALWASGAEVLWDLDYRGASGDKAFASEVLGATMAADASGTTEVDGAGVLAGLDLAFGVDAGATYPVEWPDVLASSRTAIAHYAGGTLAAVLGDGVALFGFPFETIGDEAVRFEVASRLLPELVPDYVPPEGGDTGDTGLPDTDAGDTDAPDTDAGDTDAPADTDGGPTGGPGDRFVADEAGGCGCASSTPAAAGAWLVALAVLLGGRRRRHGDLV